MVEVQQIISQPTDLLQTPGRLWPRRLGVRKVLLQISLLSFGLLPLFIFVYSEPGSCHKRYAY